MLNCSLNFQVLAENSMSLTAKLSNNSFTDNWIL